MADCLKDSVPLAEAFTGRDANTPRLSDAPMSLNSFESLLKHSLGLDAAALGRAVIDRAVRERAAVCALADWRDYLEHLRASEEELQSLVEEIVEPENWFFRDRPAFDTLGRLAVQSWLTAPHGEQLRLLSAGCGSGEEPYSMAMELMDAGFPPERLHIDAVDISAGALARARQAVYGRHAFRGADQRFSERYFVPQQDGLRLDSKARQVVTFFRGNVLGDTFLSSAPEYDFIFCRNLLIYFDEPGQQRLMQTLHRALSRQGVIFVGAGEIGLVHKPEFVPIDIPGAAAFLKAGKRQVRAAKQTARYLRDQGTPPSAAAPALRPASNGGVRTALELAAKLADRKQWPDVIRLCESYVRDYGETAQALYLIGQARDAQGDGEAARDFYCRALQLNPEHTMASLRLAQLPDSTAVITPVLNDRVRPSKQKLQP